MQDRYRRLDGESFEEYEYRICKMNSLTGEFETWNDVADVINEAWGTNFTECKFRKDWNTFQKMLPAYEKDAGTYFNSVDELKEERLRLEKEKVKMRDERNELNRLIREQARLESFKELFKECADSFSPVPYQFDKDVESSEEDQENDKTIVVMVSDLHAGLCVDNGFNYYDTDVMRKYLERYFMKIHDMAHTHGAKDCVVVLCGDLINGVLRTSNRIENNKNVIQQVFVVSDALSNFVGALSQLFDRVEIFSTPGNHGRVFQNKEEAIDGENFDNLIPYIMQEKLRKCHNVTVNVESEDETFGFFYRHGRLYVYTHGEKDNPETVATKFTMMLEDKPSAILLGHRHTNGYLTSYDCKVIQSGSGAGVDRYAIDHRMYNTPEQVAFVCDENGVDCIYDIQLQKIPKNERYKE